MLFRLCLLFRHITNKNKWARHCFRRCIWLIQIRTSNGQRWTVRTERQRGDWCVVSMELTQSLLVETIPNVDQTIRAASCKCVVNMMKTDGIHRINDFHIVLFRSMTFECKFLLLHFWIGVKVFNGNAAFNWAHHIAFFVRKHSNRSRLILEWWLATCQEVFHVSQIPNQNFSIRCSDNDAIIDAIHGIDFSVVLFVCSNAFAFSCVPKFECFIPAAGEDSVDFCCHLNTFDCITVRADNFLRMCI